MDITVILCTYNRSESLAKALASVALLELSPGVRWEVLVVDNNSRDQTPAVVRTFSGKYPGRFRYLFEPRPGKSFALNAGISDAQGSILAFLDDDVVVDTKWLEELTGTMRNGEWAGAGGRIIPGWSSPPPKWLPCFDKQALGPLVAFDPSSEAGPLLEPPFGTNMAFRKTMFEKHGGFRTDLGPRPGSEIRSEDTEFGSRVLAAGERLRYEPTAVVYHEVPQNRVRKIYFLRWWFDKARADVRELGVPENIWRIHGVPVAALKRVITWSVRWLLTFEPSRRFSCKINVWINAGAIAECYGQTPIRPAPAKTELT
ncbi:MAG: glycosyltransferase [Candidatus Sulfotelmatobacter sp.]